jgi:hypothetical protein
MFFGIVGAKENQNKLFLCLESFFNKAWKCKGSFVHLK